MRLKAVAGVTLAILMLVIFVGISPETRAAATAVAEPCDRSCLSGFVDQYLAALLKHDPAGLPVAANVKSTENTRPTPLGEGLPLRTATARCKKPGRLRL